MAHCYFDESIRDNGGFIIGALVASDRDLSLVVANEWTRLGLDPETYEYKSSDLKAGSRLGVSQRSAMSGLLFNAKLGLVVAPIDDRRNLGVHCTQLMLQLLDTESIPHELHHVYLDEGIIMKPGDTELLAARGVVANPGSDSRRVGGIQVADHAAHSLGGMLLEEMGIIRKKIRAGADSGYDPDEMIELGFELWADTRYSLIGRNEYIEGLSPPADDPANPYFRVDGVGMYVAPTCSPELSAFARKRLGVNYLGCIH